MLAGHCRRWPSIEPTCLCWINAGQTLQTVAQHWTNLPVLDQCWPDIADGGPALNQLACVGSMLAGHCHLHLSSCLLPADSWISRICAMSSEPPSSLANSCRPDNLTWVWPPHYSQETGDVTMNIHVARTPPFRTGFTHTCCQGQTGSLTVRPDRARWTSQTMAQHWTSLSVSD